MKKIEQTNISTSQDGCTVCQTGKIHRSRFDVMGRLIRLVVGLALFLAALFFVVPSFVTLTLYSLAYIVFGYDVVYRAMRGIIAKRLFDEYFLMSVATLAAMLIGQYPEAVAVMLFYQVGAFFQDKATDRARQSIAKLQAIRPDIARVLEKGLIVIKDPSLVQKGDNLVILPGDRVPVDGVITEGSSDIDTSAMTGESLVRAVQKNDTLLAGFINQNGRIKMKAIRPAETSAVSRMLQMTQEATQKKAVAELFITRFAAIYTPAVVLLAVLMAVVPPLLFGQDMMEWIYRALILLVIACPCALVLSIPFSYFAGIGAASKQGLLLKGGQYLDRLADIDTLVFDKTGTLTKGEFDLFSIEAVGMSESKLLNLVAFIEQASTHPLAQSVVRANGQQNQQKEEKEKIIDLVDMPGYGVKANVGRRMVLIGNLRLMKKEKIVMPKFSRDHDADEAVLFVAIDKKYAGRLLMTDRPKEGVQATLQRLKKQGIRRLVLLSGDRNARVQAFSKELGLDEAYGACLPDEKVKKMEDLMDQAKGAVIYLGDGMNDAPILTRADVGIAMGNGSDAAVESADAILIGGDIKRLPDIIQLAKKTRRIVGQNISLTLGLKFLIMVLAVLGLGGMWQAIFADVGVSLLAILNALRIAKKSRR